VMCFIIDWTVLRMNCNPVMFCYAVSVPDGGKFCFCTWISCIKKKKNHERGYLWGRICNMCCIATLAFAIWYKTVVLGVELIFVEYYEQLTHSW